MNKQLPNENQPNKDLYSKTQQLTAEQQIQQNQWDQKFGKEQQQPSTLKYAQDKVKEWMTWDQRHSEQPLKNKQDEWSDWDKQHKQTATVSEQSPGGGGVQISYQIQPKPMNLVWNQKPNPEYKLKYYNYFTETAEQDHQVNNYMKYNIKSHNPPQLNYYVRYNPAIYQSEIDDKGKYYYSQLMEDAISSKNLIYNKMYQGLYSQQNDYFQFKQELLQNNLKQNQKS